MGEYIGIRTVDGGVIEFWRDGGCIWAHCLQWRSYFGACIPSRMPQLVRKPGIVPFLLDTDHNAT